MNSDPIYCPPSYRAAEGVSIYGTQRPPGGVFRFPGHPFQVTFDMSSEGDLD
jgi:hypothetical protein